MGDKSIKNKNVKKKKKTDITAPTVSLKSLVVHPEIIKKKKKDD